MWVPGLKFVPAEFAQAIRQPRVPPASGHARLIGDCREKQLTTKQAVKWVPLKFTQAEKTIKGYQREIEEIKAKLKLLREAAAEQSN